MLLRVAYKRSRVTEDFNVYLRGKKTRLPSRDYILNWLVSYEYTPKRPLFYSSFILDHLLSFAFMCVINLSCCILYHIWIMQLFFTSITKIMIVLFKIFHHNNFTYICLNHKNNFRLICNSSMFGICFRCYYDDNTDFQYLTTELILSYLCQLCKRYTYI